MSSILIIGGGLAGLFTALKLAPHPCTLLTPTPLGEGTASAWAQGGIAAAIGEGDSVESHVADTLKAGAGLCDEARVRLMASEASARILDLLAYNVPFDKDLAGKLVQSREAAHSAHRIVRVKGDRAGAAIMAALITAVQKTPSIRLIEGAEAVKLRQDNQGRINGAEVVLHNQAGETLMQAIKADHTILATGGIGHLYALTTNPIQACGAGLAMALAVGAKMRDLEFVQFHPTALDLGLDPAPLATEALRGEGAILINHHGERFMLHQHKDAELGPRDVVARAVFAEYIAGRQPMLDARQAVGSRFPASFPNVYATCLQAGIDPITMPMPIAPAEHYHMGGIEVDEDGRSSCAGLYAVGEVASTGVHGANRLASNSLLEAVVFGARLADALRQEGGEGRDVELSTPQKMEDAAAPPPAVQALREAMTKQIGVVRDAAGMREALRLFATLAQEYPNNRRLQSMISVTQAIAEAALARQQSCGAHFREDDGRREDER